MPEMFPTGSKRASKLRKAPEGAEVEGMKSSEESEATAVTVGSSVEISLEVEVEKKEESRLLQEEIEDYIHLEIGIILLYHFSCID